MVQLRETECSISKGTNKFKKIMSINYNGKKFKILSNSVSSLITSEVVFNYFQSENIVSAEYSGREIKKGQLIGLVDSEGCIDMRYQQISSAGELLTGICKSKPVIMPNGKIKIFEEWSWTSGDKTTGKSVLIEL